MTFSVLRKVFLSDPDVCKRIRVITIREEVEPLVETLRRLGALQIDEPKLAGEKERRFIEELHGILSEAQLIVNEFIKRIEGEKIVKLEAIPQPEDMPKILRSLVAELKEDLNHIRLLEQRINEAKSRVEYLEKILSYLAYIREALGDIDVNDIDFDGEMVKIWTLEASQTASKRFLDELRDEIEVIARICTEEKCIQTIAFSRDIVNEVERKISEIGLTRIRIPYRGKISQVIHVVNQEIENLKKELGLEVKVNEIVEKNLERIAMLKLVVENELSRLAVLQLGIATQYVFVVEGWIPGSTYSKFIEYIEKNLRYAVIESVEVVEEPPIELRNPKPLKPFEVITKLYGYPSPNEWDPTPILAYSFAAFYGIMLGDAGYGIGQIIATRYVLPKLVENPEAEDFRNLQKVLYVTGAVSIVLGLLMGSFFGPRPLPISVFPKNLVETMKLLMALSLLIGFVHVVIAHMIAAAKNFKLGNRWVALNEVAIIMAMVFGGPYALHMIKQVQLPEPLVQYVLQPLTFVSIALIIVSKIKSLGGIGIMLWLFDLTGALGDVLSYLRLAGLAIATVILAKVFNEIGMGIMAFVSSVAGHAIGMVLSMIVGMVFFFIAHLFNLAISVLGAFVHSLRLCMLEFSSKFFDGNGKPFKPVKMVLSRYVVLRR